METPTVRFQLDPKLDFEIAWSFYKEPIHGGVDFWTRGVLRHHPDLKIFEDSPNIKELFSDYVTSLYKKHLSEFKQRKTELTTVLDRNENLFFKETEKVFKNHPWPAGEYVAYLSIFDLCPRFLDKKEFFVFMYDSDEMILFTVFHEMLHFIFYDYCQVKYPEIFKGVSTEKGPFWELAEVFNAILQSDPAFTRLHEFNSTFGYPELEQVFKSAKKAWAGDIDEWILNFGQKYMQNGF